MASDGDAWGQWTKSRTTKLKRTWDGPRGKDPPTRGGRDVGGSAARGCPARTRRRRALGDPPPPERETPMTCAPTNRHAFRLRLPRLRTTTVDRLGRRRGPRPRAEMPESRARRRSAVISAESLRKTEKGFAPTRERSRDSRCR